MWVMWGGQALGGFCTVLFSQRTFLVGSKMLPSTGLLTKLVRGGVYFCGKRVSIMWLAPGRAAAGSQQTPPEVQTTLHTLKSPWAAPPGPTIPPL